MSRSGFVTALAGALVASAVACTDTETGGAAGPGAADSGASSSGSSSGGDGRDSDAASGPGISLVRADRKSEVLDEPRVSGSEVFYLRSKQAAALTPRNIEKVPIAGGAPTVLVSDFPEASYLAVDATHVYFARRTCTRAVPCGVFRVAKTGGDVETLAKDQEGAMHLSVTGIAVDDEYVYFGADFYDQLFRVKKDGSASAEALTTSDIGIRGVQVDAQYVYWVDATVGNVKFLRLSKSATVGTAPETLATMTGTVGQTPVNVRVASMTDSEIVWSETGDTAGRENQIVRLPKAPGGAVAPVIESLRFVGSAQAFGADVFFTESFKVKKVPLAGGAATVVADDPATTRTLSAIAVDATGLYWVTRDDLRRLPF